MDIKAQAAPRAMPPRFATPRFATPRFATPLKRAALCALVVAATSSLASCGGDGSCLVGEKIDCGCKGGGVEVVCPADGITPPCLCGGKGGGTGKSGALEWSKDGAVVVDTLHALMWQRVVPTGTFTWQQAKIYCDELVLSGYDDWILPHRDELLTLVVHSTTAPAIDTVAFPDTPAKPFWTRTLYAPQSTTHAWGVDFEDGGDGYAPFHEVHHARCARVP